jgi:hypothetical protein
MGTASHYSVAACLALWFATAWTAEAADVPVFVFAGQSNAVGINNVRELTPGQLVDQPNVLYYGPNENGNTWDTLTPSDNSPNAGGGFGAEISTGRTISDALGGALVAEVKFAQAATNLFEEWNPNGVDNLYDRMVVRVNQSLVDLERLGHTGFVAGFFWMQGESDAGRSDYAANLTNLIASVRANFGDPNLPFVFGQIIDFDPPNSTTIRTQQQTVADTVANTAYILTDDLGHNDFIHFSGQGIYTLGERFGAGYLSIVAPAGKLTICHKQKKTRKIDAADFADHQAHGDTLGACGSQPTER